MAMETDKVVPIFEEQPVYLEAAEWVVRMEQGPLSDEEVARLREWAGRSELHRRILADTARVSDRMDHLRGLSRLLAPEPARKVRPRRSWPAAAALAASVLVAVAVLVARHPAGDAGQEALAATQSAVYESAVGEVRTVALVDGSEVTLNTATMVRVEITDSVRRAELVSGEAFFKVASNPRVPFVVEAGETRVQVVGTAFTVRRERESVEVTVAEGIVEVMHVPPAVEADAPSAPPVIEVQAGQTVELDAGGQAQVQELDRAVIARRLLWQQRMLGFDGEPLAEVVEEFGRYTHFRVEIADEETAGIRVGGYFRSDDFPSFLTSLKTNFDLVVEQTAPDVFRVSRAPD
jgi:transmembrane sensor